MTQKNILFTLKNNLCTGCGICEDICPAGSISIKLKNGLFIPELDVATCLVNKGCNKCFRLCPGHSMDIKKRENILFPEREVKIDIYAGHYQKCYSGYSLNHDIRYHSASGGLLSQFLIFLLEKGVIDGAVVTGFDEGRITIPKVFIATTPVEIISARSSKYCPVSMNKIGNELCKRKGKYIIVGLPCHIQGFRKREEIDPKFKQKIFGYFSIYCSSNRSFLGTEFLFKKYRIKSEDISYFAYRDEGCLGSMKIVDKYGISKTIPYLDYYPSMRSFFKPRRCLSCIDHYGALADVCFGDIHVGSYKEDKIGVNSLIVRAKKFDKLFNKATQDGYISLSEISISLINESQKTMLFLKKRKVYALQKIDKLFGKEIAQYDEDLTSNITIKDIFGICFTNIQRFIGRTRRLWFIINLINKIK